MVVLVAVAVVAVVVVVVVVVVHKQEAYTHQAQWEYCGCTFTDFLMLSTVWLSHRSMMNARLVRGGLFSSNGFGKADMSTSKSHNPACLSTFPFAAESFGMTTKLWGCTPFGICTITCLLLSLMEQESDKSRISSTF